MKGQFLWKFVLGIVLCLLCCGAVVAVFSVFTLTDLSDRYRDVYRESLKTLEKEFNLEVYRDDSEENIKKAFENLSYANLGGLALFSLDGAVLLSTDERVNGAFISGGIKREEEFQSGKGFYFVYDLNGDREMFIFNAYEGGDYRLACFVDYESFERNSAKYVLFRVLEVLCLIFVLAAFWLYSYNLWRRRKERLPKASPAANYLATVNMSGKILEKDEAFAEKYPLNYIGEENVVSGEFRNLLVSGKSFLLKLKDIDGNDKYFVCSAVEAGLKYKLILTDMDREIREYTALKKADILNSDTGFYREKMLVERWIEYKEKEIFCDVLVLVLRVVNLEYYRTLFGDGYYSDAKRVYADVLKKTIAPYGEMFSMDNGDFLLLITDKDKKAEFLQKINSLESVLTSPISVHSNNINLEIKYGVAINDGVKVNDVENLVYAGNLALKNALKATSSNRYIIRGGNFDVKSTVISGAQEILHMLKTGQVEVMYQPQVRVSDRRIIGFEALTRLKGAKQKEMTTAEFIKACEQSGAILDLGEFVYNQAMDFAALVSKVGISVSVNVSPIQLMQDGFVEKFLAAYRERKLKDGSIAVEIVESTVLHSIEEVIKKLNVLKANGISSHIDDFGVAYSSVLYLMKLPVTVVKLDKSLIDEICYNEKSLSIVSSVIGAAEKMNIKSLAESVETEEQLELLKEIGCDYIQGYLSGRAIPKDKAVELIKEMAYE